MSLEVSENPRRPVMRYHGGKWKLAPWIISHFPPHRIYVEPYGGAASVLVRKERSYAEIYNDLDGEVVNVFRMMRNHGEELNEMLRLTPFSREDYLESYFPSDSPIEQARRTIARSFMGFGSAAVTKSRHTSTKFTNPTTGFRANSNRSGSTPAHDWANYADAVPMLIERLRGIVIENRDAIEVMTQQDSVETLHYVDPPYVFSTRDGGTDYKHELNDEQHAKLLHFLKGLTGMVVLSGYACELYDATLDGWIRIEREAYADGAAPRTEVLWLNQAADLAKMANPQGILV